jgi:hypothetical protein
MSFCFTDYSEDVAFALEEPVCKKKIFLILKRCLVGSREFDRTIATIRYDSKDEGKKLPDQNLFFSK